MTTSASQTPIGQLIDGRYEIVREIAVGGMGTVYEAIHVKIGRTVAVKVLHREMATDSGVVARFINEARTVGTLGHPNIVASTDFGEMPGHVPYLVLEYLQGRTLSQEIEASGPLAVRRALRISQQIASALEAAHARGIVHRDLTSGNIFLTDTDGSPDHAKVLDFGISKFLTAPVDTKLKTRGGITMGTPEFMAPEQITAPETVDYRADIYALGVVLHHMLAGAVPFGNMPMQALLTHVILEPPPPIERGDVPDWIRAIVARALAKNAADRFQSAREMRDELEQFGSLLFVSGVYSARVEPSGAPQGATAGVVTPQPGTFGAVSAAGPVTPRLTLASLAQQQQLLQQAAPLQAPPPAAPARGGARLVASVAGIAVVAAGLAAAAAVYIQRSGSRARPATEGTASASALPSPAAEMPPVAILITSRTPQARVTLRGRTHALPYSEEVKRDSKLEIVELSGHGREGRRFWLTIDKPIRLSADLQPGRGLVDATAEETLVALGERPSDDVPVEPENDSSSVGNRATGGSPSRRPGARTSKRAGDPAGSATVAGSADPPTLAQSPSLPPADPTEPSTPPPPAQPAPAKPPGPEPPAPASPPPAAAVAARPPSEPARPPASAPAPSPGAPEATQAPTTHAPAAAAGALDPALVQNVMRDHAVDVQRCHQRGKLENSDLRGRIAVRFVVGIDGEVASATMDSSNLHNRTAETCIITTAENWRFPAPKGGAATFSHVFNLR